MAHISGYVLVEYCDAHTTKSLIDDALKYSDEVNRVAEERRLEIEKLEQQRKQKENERKEAARLAKESKEKAQLEKLFSKYGKHL